MILRIIVAQVTTQFDVLLEQRLLQYEARLRIEDVVAAATGLSLRMLGASALDREASVRPKTMLMDDLFHPLKPPWIIRVVIRKIK